MQTRTNQPTIPEPNPSLPERTWNMVKMAMEGAQEIRMQGKQCKPFLFHFPDGQERWNVYAFGKFDEEEKNGFAAFVGSLVPIGPCVMVIEAWLAHYPNDEKFNSKEFTSGIRCLPEEQMPRNRPDRKEVIMISLYDKNALYMAWTLEIFKDGTLDTEWKLAMDTRDGNARCDGRMVVNKADN